MFLTARADSGRKVEIPHLEFEGHSRCVIRRKFTGKTALEHIGRNASTGFLDNTPEFISMDKSEFLRERDIYIVCLCSSMMNQF